MYRATQTRRSFLANAGKTLGLAAAAVPAIGAMAEQLRNAGSRVSDVAAAAAQDEAYWATIRQSFSTDSGIINLNNGGVSPSPRIVTEAFVRYSWQQEDATAYTMWQILEPQSERIRAELARLFGCDAEEIAITRNASESLEILLFGMDLRPGDEILTTTQDYPRMLTTLRQRQRREGIVLKTVKVPLAPRDPREIVRAFEQGITPRTRLILVCHVINITGQIVPVREIVALGRAHGIETIVDGAHSYAHFPFTRDDLQCDYFGSSLHKWLFAPKGTGLLYVKRDKIAKIWPLMAAESAQAGNIRKFEEIGTHPAAPRLAIGEALLFHHAMGGERKAARLRYLSRYWMNRLRELPGVRFHTSFDDAQSCGIATFDLDGVDPGELACHLMNVHRIFVTSIGHDEFRGIRVTPNVYTTLDELDQFCAVVEKVARKGLPHV